MTNPFFQNAGYAPEQELLEDLIIEAISIYGTDCMYLPRKLNNYDEVLGEDTTAYFDEAVPFDVYIKTADSMGGQSNFLSRFGIEVRDQIVIVTPRRTWADNIGNPRALARPREGDLVWFARDQRLFEIRYVERYSMIYPLGSLPTWEMQCELFEANSTRFDTGIPEIDAFESATTEDLLRIAVSTAGGIAIRTAGGDWWAPDGRIEAIVDPLDESRAIQRDANAIIDFSELDPFSDGKY